MKIWGNILKNMYKNVGPDIERLCLKRVEESITPLEVHPISCVSVTSSRMGRPAWSLVVLTAAQSVTSTKMGRPAWSLVVLTVAQSEIRNTYRLAVRYISLYLTKKTKNCALKIFPKQQTMYLVNFVVGTYIMRPLNDPLNNWKRICSSSERLGFVYMICAVLGNSSELL